MEILVIFILILINGVFSLTEAAFMSSRKSYLHAREKKGDKNAIFLLKQLADPEHFLSSIQVCITLIGIISGAFGGMALSDDLSKFLASLGMDQEWAGDLAVVIVIALITYFSIVLGELVPKTFAMRNSEQIVLFFAPLIRMIMFLFKPIIGLLSVSTRFIIWASGMKKNAVDPDVVNEIVSIIKMASSNQELEKDQERIILNTINSTKAKIHDIMVERDDIKYVKHDDSLDYTLQVMFQYRHTRYPVIGGSLNEVVGYVNLKDLSYYHISEYQGVSIANIKRPIAQLNHNMNILDAMRIMIQGNSHIAIAVDKKNHTRGMITLEDIIEYLIGDINDEYDNLPEYLFTIAADHYIVGGGAKLQNLEQISGLSVNEGKTTIAAYLLGARVQPVVGGTYDVKDLQIVITKTRNHKIMEVVIKRKSSPPSAVN